MVHASNSGKHAKSFSKLVGVLEIKSNQSVLFGVEHH